MKLFCLFTISIFALQAVSGQESDNAGEIDSLRKYSYNISGRYTDPLDPGNITNYTATGFFLNDQEQTIFVTARHVLSGCKDRADQRRVYPEKMSVALNDEDGHFIRGQIPIDLRPLRDTGVCPAIKYPDIIAYPVNDSFKSKVFSIETLIRSDLAGIKGPLRIAGFPVSRNVGKTSYSIKESSPITIDRYQILDSFNFINEDTELEVDSTNYIVIPKGITVDTSLKGYSGSPVFEWNENAWRFIGVLMGANIKRKYLVIVKPQFLRQEISRSSGG